MRRIANIMRNTTRFKALMKLHAIFTTSLLLASFLASAQSISPYADALIRYENETNQLGLSDRERIRLIASAGIKGRLNSQWQYQLGLSTGLKNKQNVPAITIARINSQPRPDQDIFVQKAFLQRTSKNHTTWLGKIPWKSWQVTDAFWDRHLHPLGVHHEYKSDNAGTFVGAVLTPLDGAEHTIGKLSVLQWQHEVSLSDNISLKYSPWFAIYRGEANARFAKRDTELDNSFANFSFLLSSGNWRLGADYSHSMTARDAEQFNKFSDQRNAWSVELAHGNLKQVGNTHAALRLHHIERFAVVSEFAQNAVNRFATSNFKGIDLRVRRKVAQNLWAGLRLSRSYQLIGDETSTRLRFEAKISF